jgi:F-type H+-transporting ATPase subunit b
MDISSIFQPRWEFVWTIVNLVILFLFLRKFLFKRVTAVLDSRADGIAKNIEAADRRMAEANELKEQYDAMMREAEKRSVEIVADAKLQAENEAQAILREARTEAGAMIARANAEINRQEKGIVDAARKQIIDIALSVSSKVLKKDMDEQSNIEYIERLFDEEGAA